mmetsp:Transcript_15516/g.22759  ORF Transcript_15516/g.22759 Transcript_15516/m.22759 type:complete len:303 (-) Transcript_15516:54-962(-)
MRPVGDWRSCRNRWGWHPSSSVPSLGRASCAAAHPLLRTEAARMCWWWHWASVSLAWRRRSISTSCCCGTANWISSFLARATAAGTGRECCRTACPCPLEVCRRSPSADSSLDPTHPPDGGMLDNMAMVFGVDKHGGLWSLQSQIQSDFPGPMYPIGFRLIQKVESYLEAEDELDTVRRSPVAADNDEEVCAEKAGREADAAVDDAANATKKSTEDFISISLQSPGRQCGYLQQWRRRTRRRCSPHSSATSWLLRPRSSPATSSPSSVESAASARRPSAQQRIKSWLEPRWKECGRRPWSRR